MYDFIMNSLSLSRLSIMSSICAVWSRLHRVDCVARVCMCGVRSDDTLEFGIRTVAKRLENEFYEMCVFAHISSLGFN